jgi:hypothetical protein
MRRRSASTEVEHDVGRRIESIIGLMPGAWIVIASLMLGPPPPPIEGPTRDPDASDDENKNAEPPGIEFAPAPTLEPGALPIEVPPPPEGVEEGPAAPPPPDDPTLWPDPGTAPPDGAAAFVTVAVMISAGVLVPVGLLQDPTLTSADRSGIIGAAIGMEVIAALGLGLAVSRRVKLVRWAGAYRVQPTPQGGGLLTFGGIALTAGLTLMPLGFWIMSRGGARPQATAMVIGGAASLGVAPLGIVFGKRNRDAYLSTGGWIRRPLPPVTLAPRLLVLPGGFGVSLAGRF